MSKILLVREVVEITRRRRSTLYADVKAGRFPRPLALGPRARGWLESDIEQWIRDRADARHAAA